MRAEIRRWAPIAVLGVLLAGLGALQWAWSGELAAAEEGRRREGAQRLAERIAAGLDRELTRAAVTLHPGSGADPVELWADWGETAARAELVASVWWLHLADSDPEGLRSEAANPSFGPAPVPEELAEVLRTRAPGVGLRGEERLPILVMPAPGRPPVASADEESVRSDGPVRTRRGLGRNRRRAFLDGPEGAPGSSLIVLALSAEVLSEGLLPDLLADEAGVDPELRVGLRDPRGFVAWAGGAAPRGPDGAVDVEKPVSGLADGRQLAELLRQRRDEGPRSRRPLLVPPPGGPRGAPGAPGPGGVFSAWRRHEAEVSGWAVVVDHRSGSLERAVQRHRRRNLALGLSTLGLLAATVGALLVGTRRAQDLARQRLDLVAGITHDLRSPIAAIASLADNLRDGVVASPPEVERYGATIGSESRRLRDLVEQGLALAGLEAVGGREMRRFDLEASIRRAVADSAEVGGCEVRIEVDPGLEAVGDPGLILRAVTNLVANARRHGEGAPVRVLAAADPHPVGREVRVVVEDEGPGLPGDGAERLFEPFARGDRARRRGLAGSGLGLAVVRRVAEVHGGTVRARSRAGGGARFELCWPGAVPREDAPARGGEPPGPQRAEAPPEGGP